MLSKEMLKRLGYSKCDCAIDIRESIGIVNGICPNHSNSKLTIDGVRAELFQKLAEQKKDGSKKEEG